MSLLLVYHDRKRAVIVSDDRMTRYDAAGVRRVLEERACKFALIGSMILGAVGRHDLSRIIMTGTERMVAASGSPEFSLRLVDCFPAILRQAFGLRKASPNIPVKDDKLDVTLMGFDAVEHRLRSFVFRSEDNFSPFETTSAEENRVFALGAFDVSDEGAMNGLTQRMRFGKLRHVNWVASMLRDAMNEISARWPEVIGRASYYAALDARGAIPLANEFVRPPTELSPAPVALATAGRFYLGSIKTPQATGPDTSGNDDGGIGAQGGSTFVLTMQVPSQSLVGNASISNPVNAVDGDQTTYATLTVTGNGASNLAQLTSGVSSGIRSAYRSLTMSLLFEIPTNSLSGANNPVVTVQLSSLDGTVFATQTVNAGTTLGLTTLSADIPTEKNLALVTGMVQISTGAGGGPFASSGSLVVRMREVKITGVQ